MWFSVGAAAIFYPFDITSSELGLFWISPEATVYQREWVRYFLDQALSCRIHLISEWTFHWLRHRTTLASELPHQMYFQRVSRLSCHQPWSLPPLLRNYWTIPERHLGTPFPRVLDLLTSIPISVWGQWMLGLHPSCYLFLLVVRTSTHAYSGVVLNDLTFGWILIMNNSNCHSKSKFLMLKFRHAVLL